jgi:hypothetical protein
MEETFGFKEAVIAHRLIMIESIERIDRMSFHRTL